MLPIVRADGVKERELLKQLEARSGEVDRRVTETVGQILDRVRTEGNTAVKDYTLQFDGVPVSLEAVGRDQL